MTLDLTDDVIAGVDYLSSRFGVSREDVIPLGHSFGSLSVLLASRRLASRTVVALGCGNPEQIFTTADG